MKANVPRSYNSLPASEKEKISRLVDELVTQGINHEEAEVQKIWIQYACIVLHTAFHFTKEDCEMFIANWRRIYRQNAKFRTKQEQDAFLEKYLDFFGGDYPTAFVDSLEKII